MYLVHLGILILILPRIRGIAGIAFALALTYRLRVSFMELYGEPAPWTWSKSCTTSRGDRLGCKPRRCNVLEKPPGACSCTGTGGTGNGALSTRCSLIYPLVMCSKI